MPRKFFWIFFYEYFSFSVTWDPMEAKISKRYSSLKSLLNHFKIFWTFFSVVLTKVLFWIFEILSFRFLTNFEFHHCSIWGNQKPPLSGKRSTVERNRVKFWPRGWVFSVHRVLSTLQWLRSFWGHSVHSNFRHACISKTAGRRAKQIKIWASGMSIQCTQGTFDTSVIKVILGSFSVFPISEKPVSRKRLVIERNGVKFGPRGYSVYTGYFWHLSD